MKIDSFQADLQAFTKDLQSIHRLRLTLGQSASLDEVLYLVTQHAQHNQVSIDKSAVSMRQSLNDDLAKLEQFTIDRGHGTIEAALDDMKQIALKAAKRLAKAT